MIGKDKVLFDAGKIQICLLPLAVLHHKHLDLLHENLEHPVNENPISCSWLHL